MYYKLENEKVFSAYYYKQLSDNSYIDNTGSVFHKEEFEHTTSKGKLIEVTETEFLTSVMGVIKTKKSLISDYESDINNLQFLFHVG